MPTLPQPKYKLYKAESAAALMPKKLLSIPRPRMIHPSSVGIKKSPKIAKTKLIALESTDDKSISSNDGTCEPKTVISEQTVKPSQSEVLFYAPSEIKDRYSKILKFL